MTATNPKHTETHLDTACQHLSVDLDSLGIMIVDHGSRRAASNDALLEVVAKFREAMPYRLVEPAHMELAEPSIQQAFDKLVADGAKVVVVHPYFLLPGRHWAEDIPRLAAEAGQKHDGVRHLVTAPLGIHALMAQIMNDRIQHCMLHVGGAAESCDLCDENGRCRSSTSGPLEP